jgi:hypothetical protein
MDAGLRLAFPLTIASAEGAADLLEVLENPLLALGIALVAGLLLYAIDIPAKTHVMRVGDPARGKGLPSTHLSQMLSNTIYDGQETSLYFLLQDRYMHPETHRRIYLFGSLFRIFVDLRVLAGFFLLISTISGFMVRPTMGSPPEIHPLSVWTALTAGVWVTGYFYGIGQHAINSAKKHKSGLSDFVKRHAPKALRIWPIATLVLAVNALAVALTISASPVLAVVVVGAVGFALWLRTEVGPPNGLDYWPGVWWRLVRATGAALDSGLSVHQRAILDIATFGPWLVAANYLVAALGREPQWITAWLVFLLPIGLVLGFHKHEDRLRNSYGDQNTWLDLHKAEVAKLNDSGELPEKWS